MSDGKEVQRWVDPAMFASEKLSADNGPKVYLLQAPADPLGAIAAACKMYKGEVVRDLATVTDGERRDYLEQVLKTRLQMPFETVQFHFLWRASRDRSRISWYASGPLRTPRSPCASLSSKTDFRIGWPCRLRWSECR
jgi:hypothetical protein